MNSYIHTCSLLGVFLFVSISVNANEPVTLSPPPNSIEYMVGSPIAIFLHWHNMTEDAFRLPIRAREIHVMKLFVQGGTFDTQTLVRIRSSGGGFSSFLNDNTLPAYSERESSIFLNDYIVPIPIGEYSISIEFKQFPPIQTTVHVTPETPEGVEKLMMNLSENWKIIQTATQQSKGDALMAKRYIVLTEHPMALPFQIRLFECMDIYPIDYYDKLMLIDALVAARTLEAVRVLQEKLLNDTMPHNYARNHLLVALREADAKNWTGEIYNLIAPYLNEIESAQAIFISD